MAQPPNAFLCTLRAKLLVLHCSGGPGCWLPGEVLSRRGGQCDVVVRVREVDSSWGAVTPNFLQLPESTDWGGGSKETNNPEYEHRLLGCLERLQRRDRCVHWASRSSCAFVLGHPTLLRVHGGVACHVDCQYTMFSLSCLPRCNQFWYNHPSQCLRAWDFAILQDTHTHTPARANFSTMGVPCL